MLKYSEYIGESAGAQKLKEGDKVIFNPGPKRVYYRNHKGAKGVVSFVYSKFPDDYSIKLPGGVIITAHADELTKIDDKNPPSSATSDLFSNYIDDQFKKPEPTNTFSDKSIDTIKQRLSDLAAQAAGKIEPKKEAEMKTGDRVLVNGKVGNTEFIDRKGTLGRGKDDYFLVEFDEDESKNFGEFSMLINKSLITRLDEPSVPDDYVISTGDKVVCVDKYSQFFNKTGIVGKTWEDGEMMVNFPEDVTSILMTPKQVKMTKKGDDFTKKTIPVTSSTTAAVDEEEDEDGTKAEAVPMKKSDLLEFSYLDVFKEEKISTREDILANIKKYEKIIENPDIPEFKKVFMERSLRIAEIIDSYYEFLINKISKDGLPVFRTVEQIESVDLLITKTKVRASDSKELSRKYSFDQGIIAYWIFSDAIVFKTI